MVKEWIKPNKLRGPQTAKNDEFYHKRYLQIQEAQKKLVDKTRAQVSEAQELEKLQKSQKKEQFLKHQRDYKHEEFQEMRKLAYQIFEEKKGYAYGSPTCKPCDENDWDIAISEAKKVMKGRTNK